MNVLWISHTKKVPTLSEGVNLSYTETDVCSDCMSYSKCSKYDIVKGAQSHIMKNPCMCLRPNRPYDSCVLVMGVWFLQLQNVCYMITRIIYID